MSNLFKVVGTIADKKDFLAKLKANNFAPYDDSTDRLILLDDDMVISNPVKCTVMYQCGGSVRSIEFKLPEQSEEALNAFKLL